MPDTFNYFSHQKFTPNYIHGIDGEYENVSSATTESACTGVLEAGNNIMFTGAMGIIDFSATNGDTLQVKDVEYYKSVSWHVHSLKDMTDGYIIFNCVRTKGRYDSRRRAYD